MNRVGWVVFALVLLVPDSWGQTVAGAPVVAGVRFEGNRAVSSGVLRQQMATRASSWYSWLPWVPRRTFDASIFAEDLARLRTLYRDRGFLDARVDSVIDRSNGGRWRISLAIDEGPVTLIRRVLAMGLPAGFDAVRIQKRLDGLVGKPIDRAVLAEAAADLLRRLQERGYAFAQVDLQTDIDSLEVDAWFGISSGPRCRIGGIRVSGNQAVASGTIMRGLRFTQGEQFRSSALHNSQRQLYRSGVFRSVQVLVPDTAAVQSPVEVAVRVTERPFRSIRVGAGYDTDADFWALTEWTHRNFLGDARQLKVSAAVSGVERRAVVGVRQPYVWSSRNWLSLSGFVQRERLSGFEQDEAGANASFERNVSPHADLVVQASGGLVDFQADSAFTQFRVSALHDTRDDVFAPRRGVLLQVTVRERGRWFQSKGEFLQATAEGRWFRQLPFRSVLAVKALGGVIFELGEPNRVPSIERFFAGGLGSVRGWGHNALGPRDALGNPVGGLSRLEGSVELRVRLVSAIGGAVFVDVGKVGAELEDFSPADLDWAIGGGIRIFSPVGPIRFDVGYRLTADFFLDGGSTRDAWWKRRQFHLSLGQAF